MAATDLSPEELYIKQIQGCFPDNTRAVAKELQTTLGENVIYAGMNRTRTAYYLLVSRVEKTRIRHYNTEGTFLATVEITVRAFYNITLQRGSGSTFGFERPVEVRLSGIHEVLQYIKAIIPPSTVYEAVCFWLAYCADEHTENPVQLSIFANLCTGEPSAVHVVRAWQDGVEWLDANGTRYVFIYAVDGVRRPAGVASECADEQHEGVIPLGEYEGLSEDEIDRRLALAYEQKRAWQRAAERACGKTVVIDGVVTPMSEAVTYCTPTLSGKPYTGSTAAQFDRRLLTISGDAVAPAVGQAAVTEESFYALLADWLQPVPEDELLCFEEFGERERSALFVA